jgi:[1-hydroxy-2-(trimethylamino)ethyl]phosphonate dioxygenase
VHSNQKTPRDISREIVKLFNDHGDSQYGGEAVTQVEHALQCALLAEQEEATRELIVAALLHDVGHLLHALPDDAPELGVDDRHEVLAGRWLRNHFGPAVVEPVQLHVAAKRYLCATDVSYHNQLSPPSQLSLKLQGGPMAQNEVIQFEANIYFRDAIRLRRWDDTAKVSDLATPSVEHYAPMIEQVSIKGINK